MKRTKIKGGYFHNGKGKQFTVLQDALANDTKCGCGINCKDGFISLPSFDSVTGDKEGFHGFYFVDGELVTDTVPNIKEELKSFCNGGGQEPQEPQALRLTFDSIENANTLVGDASNVADWNTFFDLPTYGNPFTSVEVVGNEVRLFGGSNIEVKDDLFRNNQNIITVVDISCIIYVGDSSFRDCKSLITADFRSVTEVGTYSFGDSPNINYLNFPELVTAGNDSFYYNEVITSLTSLNFPKLVTIGNFCFSEYYALQYVNLPELVTITGYGGFSYNQLMTNINLPSLTTTGSHCFADCTLLTTVNLPSCTNLGGTVGDNNVFMNITGNTITLTVPTALMTADSGNPDGDIAYLQANNTVTIITV